MRSMFIALRDAMLVILNDKLQLSILLMVTATCTILQKYVAMLSIEWATIRSPLSIVCMVAANGLLLIYGLLTVGWELGWPPRHFFFIIEKRES
ncbi:MAG: hypothetical protein UY72_C0064G0010 [Candidatus Uhrbacteria bacterium GW2011_GWD2_52_7]|uniref:Uncharacterized protein n=1 Tax=Candidatus Uhrbacteria bacterium GW2011_GWD2_52_7 TaxID=1618989 RepID=A0A0G1ZKX9_9BACT|nr:MAG: hypothetical protein UY72_C0064G0010 [Candidatus Uhrbacteria bacterium GW2011_GWD2_52_7]